LADFKPRLEEVDKNLNRIEELAGQEKALKDKIMGINDRIS
jgi:hypothetical protein